MDALHKIISWVASPMGLMFLGLVAGGTLATVRRKLGVALVARACYAVKK